jgi:phage baseplate assembly protein V
MLRLGVISELGAGTNLGFCRVYFDEMDMVSAWLPLPSAGTKTAIKIWQPIETGSQVACLMDDDCEQGVVVAALWSNTDTPPDFASDKTIGIQFADGAKLFYDFEKKKAVFDAPYASLEAKIKEADIEASNKIKLKCDSLDITGDLNVTGRITANGQVSAMAATPATRVNLSTHVHPGIGTPPTPGT